MIPRTLFPSEIVTDARVKKLARLLRVSRPTALGHLVALWCEASLHHDGQDVLLLDPEDFAEAAGYTGSGADLAGALLESLLGEKVYGGGLRLVGYEDGNGPYRRERDAKIAASKAWRKNRKAAASDCEPPEAGCKTSVFANVLANANTGPSALPVNTPPPPPTGGSARRRTSRRTETEDLTRLGSERGTPDPKDDGALPQNMKTALAAAYRQASEQARAQGDDAKAYDFAVKADAIHAGAAVGADAGGA